MDDQDQSPLFHLPGEIRNRIFEYVVTKLDKGKEPFQENTCFYRPGFRYFDRRLDSALLCTCRRVYQETKHLPAAERKTVAWHFRSPSDDARKTCLGVPGGPPSLDGENSNSIETRPHIHTLHLFIQQYWLKRSWNFSTYSQQCPNVGKIIITLRHSDWWCWGQDYQKCQKAFYGLFQVVGHDLESDVLDPRLAYDNCNWGSKFRRFKDLHTIELELETREGKSGELDEIVEKAHGWKFPGPKKSHFVINPKKTKRTGWVGRKLAEYVCYTRRHFYGEVDHVPNDPVEAKERLKKAGVDFTIPDGHPEIEGDRDSVIVYYVVTLRFERQAREKSVNRQ